VAGVRRAPRRGQEYQTRLQKVLEILSVGSSSEDEPEQEKTEREPLVQRMSEGVLWERAQNLAKQQGEEDNDAYVAAIFKRLGGGGG